MQGKSRLGQDEGGSVAENFDVEESMNARHSGGSRGDGFRPKYPRRTSHRRLLAATADFIESDVRRLRPLFRRYSRWYRRMGYRRRMREKKSLCFEELWIIFVAMMGLRPTSIVEIGTQYGESTRKILDAAHLLGLKPRMRCYDIVDELRYCNRNEVELVLEDITGRAASEIFDAIKPQIVFLDARPYRLIEDVVRSFLEYDQPAFLAIHDCGRGICNPEMKLGRSEQEITSATGVWERHVLADVFGVADPLSPALDDLQTQRHRLRIFPTRHGLAGLRALSLWDGELFGMEGAGTGW